MPKNAENKKADMAMDSASIVKGLIQDYIKPPHPLYRVEYVKCELEWDEDEGPHINANLHVGVFNLMRLTECEITNNGIKYKANVPPLSTQKLHPCQICLHQVITAGDTVMVEYPNEKENEIRKTFADRTPYILESVVNNFNEDGDNITNWRDDKYIIISIKRVA